ncbi:MAG: MFS transporter [Opitutales bacterium]
MATTLKLRHLASYGGASTGKVAIEMLLQLYLFDFYTRILGLSPILAGAAFAIAILWDAVSDLVVSIGLFKARESGYLYTSFVLGGGIILAASTAFLFSASPGQSETALFLQLLLAYALVNTGMTLVDLPQTSMSAELSPHPNVRNKLLACRMGMGILGLVIGSSVPGIFVSGDNLAAAAQSRTTGGYVLAALVVAATTMTFVGLRHADRTSARNKVVELPNWGDAFSILKEPYFLGIFTASVIAAIGRTINAALALLYYRLVLNLSEADVTRIIFPIFTLAIVLSIPLWVHLSKRYGKSRPAWISVGSLGLMGMIAYPILPEGQLWPPVIISIIGGFFCGSVFLVDSMITDLIDRDEAATGKRKESLFFAIQKSGVKMSRAIAFVAIGGALQLTGIDLDQTEVPASDQLFIILLFGVVVGLCFVACAFFLRRTEGLFLDESKPTEGENQEWVTFGRRSEAKE